MAKKKYLFTNDGNIYIQNPHAKPVREYYENFIEVTHVKNSDDDMVEYLTKRLIRCSEIKMVSYSIT